MGISEFPKSFELIAIFRLIKDRRKKPHKQKNFDKENSERGDESLNQDRSLEFFLCV